MSHDLRQSSGLKRKLSDANNGESSEPPARCVPATSAASSQGTKQQFPVSAPTVTPASAAATQGFRGGAWQNGLKLAMTDPGQILMSNDVCSIIADKYPKARHHYLAMPKRQIESLSRVTRSDAPLLRRMLEAAKQFVADKNLRSSEFRFGFHAVPSMSQLHMHIISQDFVSPSLKNKKHWLSFTSKFFLDCDALLRILEESSPCSPDDNNPLAPRVTLRGERLAIDVAWFSNLVKQGDLKCNQCPRVCKNIPELKAHLSQHLEKN